MFKNIFCEVKGKTIIHWRSLGEWGIVLITFWKCNFSIYLDVQVYYLDIRAITTLLCLLLVLSVLFPSIHSFFYLTTALLKSDVFRHSKAYSSHSFQPTGIGLGSLWRGNRCVLPIISVYLYIFDFFYNKVVKLFIFENVFCPKNALFKKFSKIYYYFFLKKRDNWAYVYMY